MLLDWEGLSQERFFCEYWRKKPVLIKGGADRILGFVVDVPFFRRVCDRLDRSPLDLVIRRPGFIFAQKMDQEEPRFREVSRRYEQVFSTQRAWFDGVYTTDTHTIGCHYDHSDNFVIQQSGTKHWKLAAPSMLPESELRQRMLESADVGHVFMPDECEDYIVEPSDVLYIPLFWAHWGVSYGTAMSVSLVLNADCPLDALAAPLRRVLSESRSWFLPLPMLARSTAEQGPPPEVDAALDSLVDALTRPEIRPLLKQAFWEDTFTASSVASIEPGGISYGRERVRSDARSIGLPIDRFDALRSIDRPDPEVEALLWPGVAGEALLDHFSVRVIGRLIETLEKAHGVFGGSESWPEIIRGLSDLSALPDAEALRAFRSPQLSGWLWRLAECTEFGYLPRFEEICDGYSELCSRACRGDSSNEGLSSSVSDAWLSMHYPRGRRYGGRRIDASDSGCAALGERLSVARKKLGQTAPELGRELALFLPTALPMQPLDGGAAHFSIEPFVGLVLLEPERFSIEDLGLEIGRAKGRAIAEVGELFDETIRGRVISPFDGGEVSARRLFADAFGEHYRAMLLGQMPPPSFQDACNALISCRVSRESGRALVQKLRDAERERRLVNRP